MKINKKLILIIVISLLALGGLVFSVYKIVSKNKEYFYTDGYVSVFDEDNAQKVYFNSGANYKSTYNDEITFKDTDNTKQTVSKQSLIYYNNRSIEFLTSAVLMDLDKIGDEFIPYYNIKSNYLIQYENNTYKIETKDDNNLTFNNFITRIDENKYVVVGNDIKLKLSGNEDYISSNYFEIIFKDGNIVKINYDSLTVENISENVYILVGDNTKIDLANKAIFYNNELKLNLSEIVIDSNDNIDITYDEEKVNKEKEEQAEEDVTNNTTNTTNTTGEGNGNGSGSGSGSGNDNKYVDVKTYTAKIIDYKTIPYAELESYSASTHKVTAKFKIFDDNDLLTDDIVINLIDGTNGNIVTSKSYSYEDTEIEFTADSLDSGTSYIMQVNGKYTKDSIPFDEILFQKVVNTSTFGIEISKDYVTDTTLSVAITTSDYAAFDSAEINLYNEFGPVVSNGEYVSYTLNGDAGMTGTYLFTDLNPNTYYTVKVENVSYGSVTYNTVTAELKQKTLKANPFSGVVVNPTAKTDKKNYSVTFDIGEINDANNSIKAVTYYVYNLETGELVKTIEKDSTVPVEVEISGKSDTPINGVLYSGTTYYFTVSVTINDNEKDIDITDGYLRSNNFNLDCKESPSLVVKDLNVTSSMVSATLIILDPDDAIVSDSSIRASYTDITNLGTEQFGTEETLKLTRITCSDDYALSTKCYSISVMDLLPSTEYVVTVSGKVDIGDGAIHDDDYRSTIGAIHFKTDESDIVVTSVVQTNTKNFNEFFIFDLGLSLREGADESIKTNLSSFTIRLYDGTERSISNILGEITINDPFTIADLFDGTLRFTLADFANGSDLSYNTLYNKHQMNNEPINQYYIIDFVNVKTVSTAARDITFIPSSKTLTIDESIVEATQNTADMNVELIRNAKDTDYYDETLEEGTILGFKVQPVFNLKKFATNIKYTVYDVTYGTANSTKVAEKDVAITNIGDNDQLPEEVMIFGKDDYSRLSRGHTYIITFLATLCMDGSTTFEYPYSAEDTSQSQPYETEPIDVPRQEPSAVLFAWDSSSNSITYKYMITDTDGALTASNDSSLYFDIGNGRTVAGNIETCTSSTTSASGRGNYNSKYTCETFSNLSTNTNYKIFMKAKLVGDTTTTHAITNVYTSGYQYTFEGDNNNIDNVSAVIQTNENNYSNYNNLLIFKLGDSGVSNSSLNKIAYYTLTLENADGSQKFVIDNISDANLSNSAKSSLNKNYYAKSIIYYNDNKATYLTASNAVYLSYIASCIDDELSSCLYFDYAKLYSNTSNSTLVNAFIALKDEDLKVSLSATYDSGKVGYYTTGNYDKTSAKYALQVIGAYTDEENDDVFTGQDDMSVYDKKYYILDYVTNSSSYKTRIMSSALGAVYGYLNDTSGNYGFADDYRETNMTLINMTYSNALNINNSSGTRYTLSKIGYEVTKYGIVVKDGSGVKVPIVAKLLKTQTITENVDFKYNKIVPSIAISGDTSSTLNGLKVKLIVSGVNDEDIQTENGYKYAYIDIYKKTTTYQEQAEDGSEQEPIITRDYVKTIKIRKDSLLQQSFVVGTDSNCENNVCNLDLGSTGTDKDKVISGYKVDISSVFVNSIEVTSDNYDYDYRTGKITFHDALEDKASVIVNYTLVFDGLDTDTEYEYKVYMKLEGTDDLSYLANLSSDVKNVYDTFVGTFKTLSPDLGTYISNGAFDVTSMTDYHTRYLKTNFSISDIFGMDNLSYKICLNKEVTTINEEGEEVTETIPECDIVDTTKYLSVDNGYNILGNDKTIISKSGKNYNAEVQFDISKTDTYDFVFGKNYYLVVEADIPETTGTNTYEIYRKELSVRKLVEPTISVVTHSNNSDDEGSVNYYLSFDITINDPDRVIDSFDTLDDNGKYYTYLTRDDNTLLNTYYDENGTQIGTKTNYKQIKKVLNDSNNEYKNVVSYGNLEGGSGYYLHINYHIYMNNDGAVVNEERNVPFLNNTLDDFGVSIGTVNYLTSVNGSSHKSALRFFYAANIIKNTIYDEATGTTIDDPNQKAYVGGIIYQIRRISGDPDFLLSDTIFFDEESGQKINYYTPTDGDSYYEIVLDHGDSGYTVAAQYKIDYQFYLTGNITKDLNTEEKCIGAEETNVWRNNVCYTLSGSYPSLTQNGGIS